MPNVTKFPGAGQIVRVRQRQYLVEDVVLPPNKGDATLVRMACLDDDAQGQPLEVLWEREIDAEIITGEAWQSLAERGFDAPKLFSSYLHTLRWNCVTATDPRLFQSPFRAGIRIDAYQLEPLRKALMLPRVNLFIADDVGLGKTIEAGLIVRELLLRKKVRDIVVACPPSMLPQWKEEMEQRFGLTFEILDKEYIARVRQERGYGTNPWGTHTRFLISHRLLIDEDYTAPLRDWLGELRPGSILVLDEAHHAAPASGIRYAIDSKFTRAVRDLAPRFEHRLFLSATPHNGHSPSFSALLEILDPQRFCRGVPVKGRRLLEDVMVRRLKEDVRELLGGFPKRNVKQVDIDGLPADAPELRLSELLDQYRALWEERLKNESKRKQAAAGLLLCGLQQRLLSSVEAFARTLRVHRRTVDRHRERQLSGKPQPSARLGRMDLLGAGVGSDDERAALDEAQLQLEIDAQIETATAAIAGPTPDQKMDHLLGEMTRTAEDARGLPDARIRILVAWIRKHMCPGLPPPGQSAPAGPPAAWNEMRLLIFTQYDDTKRYLAEQLAAAIAGTDRAKVRIEIFHGATPQDVREEIKSAFNADPKKQPLRILIATDAAREGLNLQAHCWNLFHFDVPWNPSRMEQRNGRIDRKLQPSDEVVCHYFVYLQRPEDRVLKVLVRKTETIRKELGSLAQVLESRLSVTLQGGIRHHDVARLEREIKDADLDPAEKAVTAEELESARQRQDELRKQIDQLRTQLERSRKWINLDEEHFRSALTCSLELMGAEPLKVLPHKEESSDGPPCWSLPALDQRQGADPTWADTIDTLRAPRRRDQRIWDWRRESPIRPVIFEDPGTMDEDVVHLHLEQRVVRRLLGHFMAQGFVYHDLSRACMAQSSDAIPRVVLLGRLCLYGPGAARLHEELVPVTARWFDPASRKGALTPYAREGEGEGRTLDMLEDSLLPKAGRKISSVILNQLQATGPRDVQELLPHLERRGEALAKIAVDRLIERGEQEAKAMREILEDQKKRVSNTFDRYRDELPLKYEEEEWRQLESNRRHWDKRLAALEHEIRTEPERIRQLYEVKARRIEPVGLVYLWPVTG